MSWLAFKGWSINKLMNKPDTQLLQAAHVGNLEAVRSLINKGASVHAGSDARDGVNALHAAAMGGHELVVRELLKAGADVHAVDKAGRNALHYAASRKGAKSTMILLLLQPGVDVNLKTQRGTTPLMFAAGYNTVEAVELLTSKDADVTCADEDGLTALHYASAWNKDPAVISFLIKANPSLQEQCDSAGHTPLHYASKMGNVAGVRHLIKCGAEVQATNQFGETAQELSCTEGEAAGNVELKQLVLTALQQAFGICRGTHLNIKDVSKMKMLQQALMGLGITGGAITILGTTALVAPVFLMQTVSITVKVVVSSYDAVVYNQRKAERLAARVKGLGPVLEFLQAVVEAPTVLVEGRHVEALTDYLLQTLEVLLGCNSLLLKFSAASSSENPSKRLISFLRAQAYKSEFDGLTADLTVVIGQLNLMLGVFQVALQMAQAHDASAPSPSPPVVETSEWKGENTHDHQQDMQQLEQKILQVMGGVEGLKQQLEEQQVELRVVVDMLEEMDASTARIYAGLEELMKQVGLANAGIQSLHVKADGAADMLKSVSLDVEEVVREVGAMGNDVSDLKDDVEDLKDMASKILNFIQLGSPKRSKSSRPPMFVIPRSSIRIDEAALRVGSSGAYGTVVQGTRDLGKVAVKIYNYRGLGKRDQKAAIQEALLLSRANHHNVVRCFGIVDDPEAPPADCIVGSLVMEWVAGGNLYHWLQEHHEEVDLAGRLHLAAQVAAGMKHLHEQRLVHGDLKPQNILVASQGGREKGQVPEVKICDFGLAMYNSFTMTQTSVKPYSAYTLAYTSPERLTTFKRSYQDDMYAFGILLFFIATSDSPFSDIPRDLIPPAVNAGQRPPIDTLLGESDVCWEKSDMKLRGIAHELCHLAKLCWRDNPAERPSAAAVYQQLCLMLSKLQE